MSNTIIHIPHSSNIIPHGTTFLVDEQSIQEELLRLTDWHTEDLFTAPEHLHIIAPYSRIFCDTERFADDALEVMASKGMGVIYTTLDDGRPLRYVDDSIKESILQQYYRPHHKNLRDAVESRITGHGAALIIDAHSYPDEPLQRDIYQMVPRPDINIGTDSYHTPRKLIETAVKYFKQLGMSVGINWPYQGTVVPTEYYRNNPDVYSIMLEINRKLYLKKGTNEKSENYDACKRMVAGFIEEMDKSLKGFERVSSYNLSRQTAEERRDNMERLCKEHGIPFTDSTEKYEGKTMVTFFSRPSEDSMDSAYTALRNINRRKGH